MRIIGPEPGSGIDLQARLIAQGMAPAIGQPVIVDNRAPAIMVDMAAKALPDGYTVIAGASAIWVTPLVQKTTYNPLRDFAPITTISSSPFVLIVNPSLPAKSLTELIALAKARPGELNYASGVVGGGAFLSGALFKSMAGINIVPIPYTGSALGLNAVIGGEVQIMVNTAATTMPQIKSGKVRALGVTSAEPSAIVPGVPTVAASGLPGYESTVIVGILAPAGTPAPIVDRLNREIVRVISLPEVKEKFFNTGADVYSGSPEQFSAKIKSEIAKWGNVIREAGIKVE
jgi:tripartite-type tricarboxylate transporter receptor subunit TctC